MSENGKEKRKKRLSTSKSSRVNAPPKHDSASGATADEDLFAIAVTQWKSGDWDSLSKLDTENIEYHQSRATLALLAAASYQQLGNFAKTNQFVRFAQDWGANKDSISQILIAGVYNTLGRVQLLACNRKRSLEYFDKALRIGLYGTNPPFLSSARVRTQLSQLGIDENYFVTSLGLEDCSSIDSVFLAGKPALLNGRSVEAKSVTSHNKTFSVFHRPESKGDLGVIKQVFVDGQYECGWIAQGKALDQLYAKILQSGKIPLIVDAGANIGTSCLWFYAKYPAARILAIEPDLDNCELLRNNCAGLPVDLYCGALADKSRILRFQDPGESDWGFRVGKNGDREVRCIGPNEVLDYCNENNYVPLILKIDIEGGEDLLFSGNTGWVGHVPAMIVELHDWLFPCGSTSINFQRTTADFELQLFTRDENIFCFNRNLINFDTS